MRQILCTGTLIILFLVSVCFSPKIASAQSKHSINTWQKYLNDSIAVRNNMVNQWWKWRESEINRINNWYNDQAKKGVDMNTLNNMYQNEMNRISNDYNEGIRVTEDSLRKAQVNYNNAMKQMGFLNNQVKLTPLPKQRKKTLKPDCPGCDCKAPYKDPGCAVCCDL